MTKEEIITKVKSLHLPVGTYVVYGSGPLAAVGLREAKDIDLLVTKELFDQLKQMGWQQADKGEGDKPLVHDVFDAHYEWVFGGYRPTLEHLLQTATIIDGVPFASLHEVRKWKAGSEGPKHQSDVELIDNYLAYE